MAKRIIITGTSRGIGFELVKLFASSGYEVLALSRDVNPVKALKLNHVTCLSFDLTVASSYHKVLEVIKGKWNKVDVLIHNAGALINKPFSETAMPDFETVYKTNVFGVAELTRQILPFMPSQSHVVAISSMGGIQGSMKFPGLAAYSSSKAAVITLMELLAEEYKDNGICFNTLALGAVQTEMLEQAFPGYKAPTTALEMAKYIYHFSLTGHDYHNGKVIQVSKSTP